MGRLRPVKVSMAPAGYSALPPAGRKASSRFVAQIYFVHQCMAIPISCIFPDNTVS